MTESDAVSYKYALRDIVCDLILRAKELTNGEDIAQRTALFHTLGHIKNQAIAFGLDLEYLGLVDFDPEQWYISRRISS